MPLLQPHSKGPTMKTWLFNTEKYIYKEIAKELNNMYGQTTTAPMSVGLFLKVPIRIQLIQQDKVDHKSLIESFSAYTKLGNEVEIFFDFFYSDEKSLKALTKLIEKYSTFWAYFYQHELLHILFKHITKSFDSRMTRIAKECKPKLDESTIHHYVNVAEDYFINYCIKDVVQTKSSAGFSTFLSNGLYNQSYHSAKLSDIDILRKILDEVNITNQSLGNGYSVQTTTDASGNRTVTITKDGNSLGEQSSKPSNSSGSGLSDTELSDLASAVNNVIQSHAKGSQSATALNDLFTSIQVNTDWFKKLKTRFKRDVYYATHDYYTKWSNLNNKYRQLFKSPKKYYLDSKLEIVLSIDQSGSMNTRDLQKLLYLLESEGKKIDSLTVLIHDSIVTKEFILKSDGYNITNNPQFKTALATRYQAGGTSHSCIFSRLQETVKDPSKTIYISFSDNYSNIKQTWTTYPIMKKLMTYFVCPINNPMKIHGTTDILME